MGLENHLRWRGSSLKFESKFNLQIKHVPSDCVRSSYRLIKLIQLLCLVWYETKDTTF